MDLEQAKEAESEKTALSEPINADHAPPSPMAMFVEEYFNITVKRRHNTAVFLGDIEHPYQIYAPLHDSLL